MRSKYLYALTALFLIAPLVCPADIYVPDDHATVQDAITAAAAGDTVIVRPGTYEENIDFLGKAITVRSAEGPELTILDGGDKNTTVTFWSGEGTDSVLDGFTITNGNGKYFSSIYHGGGIHCEGASPTISNNIITRNYARFGSGISCLSFSDAVIVNNQIIRNDAHFGGGGGLAVRDNSSPLIADNVIALNTSEIHGGGIYCFGASLPTITGNLLSENSCKSKGGAITCRVGSDALITHNRIVGNNAKRTGGGICCIENSSPTIENNTISDNTADDGGGLACEDFSSPAVSGCTLAHNVADTDGGGLRLFENCTVTVTDSILWNNLAANGAQIVVDGDSTNPSDLTVSYSDVQGGELEVYVATGCSLNWGTGMIDADPLFLTGPHGDHYLSQIAAGQAQDSPCLDTADPLSTMVTGATRIDRVQDGGFLDMGFHYPIDGSGVLHVPADFATLQEAIDFAWTGDTVLAAPGAYVENIDFTGKAITLSGAFGADSTFLDGNQAGSVVSFVSGEGGDSVIEGFTVTNGSGTEGMWANTFLGGGIYCDGASPTIKDIFISANTASMGGGIYCGNSSPRIVAARIIGNSGFKGAGLYCDDHSSPTVSNTLIAENEAYGHGGGICCWDNSSPDVINSTIASNLAAEGGGIYCVVSSSPVVTNSILWGNKGPEGPEIWVGLNTHPSSLTISYSAVEGGQSEAYVDSACILDWGDGMIEDDPEFVNAGDSDYHITWNSSCRNTGSDTAASRLVEDFEGDRRVAIGSVDVGADEFYYHLYIVGTPIPGGVVRFKIIGGPATRVNLYMSGGLQDPPTSTDYGDVWIETPTESDWFLGKITVRGVLTFSAYVPAVWPPGTEKYFQALVGKWGDPSTVLTNWARLYVQ